MIQRLAHAKINLTLDVLFRREDGFHEIETIFQTVSLADEVRLQLAGENRLTSEGYSVPLDESNLCLKAIRLFQSQLRWPLGVHIHLVKHIPLQAGLGGGSSNAAAVLMCLAELAHSRGIEPPAIAPLSSQIGSDVPFFLHGGCAQAGGRGERILPLKSLPPFSGVTAMPEDMGISTQWAYEQLKRPPQTGWEKVTTRTARILCALQAGEITTGHALSAYLSNDFEEPVLRAFEPLQKLRKRMEQLGALRVLLCGSGAAQFALCKDGSHADTMAERLGNEGFWAYAVHNV